MLSKFDQKIYLWWFNFRTENQYMIVISPALSPKTFIFFSSSSHKDGPALWKSIYREKQKKKNPEETEKRN